MIRKLIHAYNLNTYKSDNLKLISCGNFMAKKYFQTKKTPKQRKNIACCCLSSVTVCCAINKYGLSTKSMVIMANFFHTDMYADAVAYKN